MYLLKRTGNPLDRWFWNHSHSTMYLLKPFMHWNRKLRILFTFHHVSIKTPRYTQVHQKYIHSHSTMYLLKLYVLALFFLAVILFTFHHVSIKTVITVMPIVVMNDSHSTMYLLKLKNMTNGVLSTVHSHSTMYLLKLLLLRFHS